MLVGNSDANVKKKKNDGSIKMKKKDEITGFCQSTSIFLTFIWDFYVLYLESTVPTQHVEGHKKEV